MPGKNNDFGGIGRDASRLLKEAIKILEDCEAVDLRVAGEFLTRLLAGHFEEVALIRRELFLVRFQRARTIQKVEEALEFLAVVFDATRSEALRLDPFSPAFE